MGKKKIVIPKNVTEFAKAKFKKFKKTEGEYVSSKKELEKMYHSYLFEFLPDTIEFLVRFGHIKTDEIVNIKDEAYKKMTDPKFVKSLKKSIKNDSIKNIKLLPILLREIVTECQRVNAHNMAKYEEEKKSNPEAKEPEYYNVEYLTELSELILAKRIKKLTKNGFDKALAFNVLTIIPNTDAMKSGQFYRISQFINTLYIQASADENPINFGKLVELVFGEEYYGMIITFSLLERKEKFAKLDDKQKTLYLNISTWCFDTMENMKKDDIDDILTSYCNNRRKDNQAGKDSNRRYSISTLPKEDYPRINKVIDRLDKSLQEYL